MAVKTKIAWKVCVKTDTGKLISINAPASKKKTYVKGEVINGSRMYPLFCYGRRIDARRHKKDIMWYRVIKVEVYDMVKRPKWHMDWPWNPETIFTTKLKVL